MAGERRSVVTTPAHLGRTTLWVTLLVAVILVFPAGWLIDPADYAVASVFVVSTADAVQSEAQRRRVEEALTVERACVDSITDAALSSPGLDDLLREPLVDGLRFEPFSLAASKMAALPPAADGP